MKRDEAPRFGFALGLVVRYDETSRSDPDVIKKTIIETPSGHRATLGQVAEVLDTTGPNTLNPEHVQRPIVVYGNTQGRNPARVVTDIKKGPRAGRREPAKTSRQLLPTTSNTAANSRLSRNPFETSDSRRVLAALQSPRFLASSAVSAGQHSARRVWFRADASDRQSSDL